MSIGPKYSIKKTSFQDICIPKSLKTSVIGSFAFTSLKISESTCLLSAKAFPLASPIVSLILLISKFLLPIFKNIKLWMSRMWKELTEFLCLLNDSLHQVQSCERLEVLRALIEFTKLHSFSVDYFYLATHFYEIELNIRVFFKLKGFWGLWRIH